MVVGDLFKIHICWEIMHLMVERGCRCDSGGNVKVGCTQSFARLQNELVTNSQQADQGGDSLQKLQIAFLN